MKNTSAIVATLGCAVLCSVGRAQAQTAQEQPTQRQPVQQQSTAAQTGQQEAASLTGEQLEAVVVTTGYTMEKKKDVVGAVAVVDLTETKDRPVGNVLQDLQGQVAGVQILTDGNPGSAATVKIRGQGLGLLGFNAPLFIVDGVPLNTTTGLQELDPHDIDSIQVLRDAASASIYGARAANRVVVITTKRGTGHMDLSATASETIQSYSYDIHALNTQQRALVCVQAAINWHNNPNNALYSFDWNHDFAHPVLNGVTIGQYTDAAGNRYIDAGLTQRVSNTDWFGAVTEQSRILDSALSLSNSTG